MINTNKINGRLAELGLTRQAIAPGMDLTPYTLGQKISNKQPMTLDEALKFAIILKISKEEIVEYFFYSSRCILQQNESA